MSLAVMPWSSPRAAWSSCRYWVGKQRLGSQLNSEATSGEGPQNLMCAAQAGAVLIGLADTATLGCSRLDPAIGLLLAQWAIYEDIEAWRGEDIGRRFGRSQ